MIDLIILYSAISPLALIFGARAVATSREHQRLPLVSELIFTSKTLSKENKKWIRIAAICAIAFCFFILNGWHRGTIYNDVLRDPYGVLFKLTAYNFGYISYILRSVYFNTYLRLEGSSIQEENNLFFSTVKFIPGFGDKVKSYITISTLIMLTSIACIFLVNR